MDNFSINFKQELESQQKSAILYLLFQQVNKDTLYAQCAPRQMIEHEIKGFSDKLIDKNKQENNQFQYINQQFNSLSKRIDEQQEMVEKYCAKIQKYSQKLQKQIQKKFNGLKKQTVQQQSIAVKNIDSYLNHVNLQQIDPQQQSHTPTSNEENSYFKAISSMLKQLRQKLNQCALTQSQNQAKLKQKMQKQTKQLKGYFTANKSKYLQEKLSNEICIFEKQIDFELNNLKKERNQMQTNLTKMMCTVVQLLTEKE